MRRSCRAFTLAELLVSIAVLFLFVAIEFLMERDEQPGAAGKSHGLFALENGAMVFVTMVGVEQGTHPPLSAFPSMALLTGNPAACMSDIAFVNLTVFVTVGL